MYCLEGEALGKPEDSRLKRKPRTSHSRKFNEALIVYAGIINPYSPRHDPLEHHRFLDRTRDKQETAKPDGAQEQEK